MKNLSNTNKDNRWFYLGSILLVAISLFSYLAHYIPGKVVVIITIIFFLVVMIILFSVRWVLTPTHFGYKTLFFKNFYPLDHIKRIYVGKMSIDPSMLSKEVDIAQGMGLKIQEDTVLNLAQHYTPSQVCLDLLVGDGSVKTIPLFQRDPRARTVGLQQFKKRLHELADRFPNIVDAEVWPYLGS
jgi:hypothetical protein